MNNRQRRAAKQRKRAQQQGGGARRSGVRQGQARTWSQADPTIDAAWAYGEAELQLTSTIRWLSRRRHEEAEVLGWSRSLLRRVAPIPLEVVALVLRNVVAQMAEDVTRGGWGQGDLEELTRRRDPRLLGTLALVLRDDHVPIDTVEELAAGIRLAALLAVAPLLDADAVAVAARGPAGGPGREHPKLAQVRALLAKAESTEYDAEAEALIGKAQELIARYALTRLLDDSAAGQNRGAAATVRRLWLDAPYVRAKAALVNEVARANRCRTAVSEQHGFSLVVGTAADLDGVELLVTSLMVQANVAMQRYAHLHRAGGGSRTRSFRQSFLLAYATRIGERLRSETEAVATESEARLLPVLRDHEAKVSEAFNALVPHTVRRGPSVNSGEGWAAGVVAADQARLDAREKLTGT